MNYLSIFDSSYFLPFFPKHVITCNNADLVLTGLFGEILNDDSVTMQQL